MIYTIENRWKEPILHYIVNLLRVVTTVYRKGNGESRVSKLSNLKNNFFLALFTNATGRKARVF